MNWWANYVFYLSSDDIEMSAHCILLLDNFLPRNNLVDDNLKRSAKHSDYSQVLATLLKNGNPVLIELEFNINISPHAIIIDHRNEKVSKDKKSEVEQIAEFLKVKLFLERQLISSIDKDFNKIMQDISVNEREIKNTLP